MNNLKYANADLVTLRQFETLVDVDRARRQRICKEHGIEIIDIGIDTRQPRIAEQSLINLYNKCLVYKPKQAGKPRGWGNLQLVSLAELRTKFNIPSARVQIYAKQHKLRILNICGSKRVPMCDIKLLLARRATIPE
jgi:hypothetical protein